ncbi:MAG: RnfABCDGE type electron transport complex subunit D, partial [Gammaproteobacteria bacterium]
RPVRPYLLDGSAIVTAMLLAFAIPPYSPWWLLLCGCFFAIIIAKHLFGGLGYNPFNPAMVGYAVLLISFPVNMTSWVLPLSLESFPHDLSNTLSLVFTGHLLDGTPILDALTMASPLDTLKTELRLKHTVVEAFTSNDLYGFVGGIGWEWVNLAILAGGLWLLHKRIITWHIPVGLMAGMGLIAFMFNLIDSTHYASPFFHLSVGATMLGAFFIATDPVTACTSNPARVVYGFLIGILAYIIRTWGGYPDGIAFGVLLMNMAAPTLDYYLQPRVFGHRRGKKHKHRSKKS